MTGFRGVGEAPRPLSAPALPHSSYYVLIPRPEAAVGRGAEVEILLREAGIPPERSRDLFHPVTGKFVGTDVPSSHLRPFARYLFLRIGSAEMVAPYGLRIDQTSLFSLEPSIDRAVPWEAGSTASVILKRDYFPENFLLQENHVRVMTTEDGVLVTPLSPKTPVWVRRDGVWTLLEPAKSHQVSEVEVFALGFPPLGESRFGLDPVLSTVIRVDESRRGGPKLVMVAPLHWEADPVRQRAREAYLNYAQDFFGIPLERTPGPFRLLTRALLEAEIPEAKAMALVKSMFEENGAPLPEKEQAKAAEFFGKLCLGLKALEWDGDSIHRLAKEFTETFEEKQELRDSLKAEDLLVFYAGLQGTGLSLRDQRIFLCRYLHAVDHAVREDFFLAPGALKAFVSMGMSPTDAMEFLIEIRRNISPLDSDFMPALQDTMRALVKGGIGLKDAQAFLEKVSEDSSAGKTRSANALPETSAEGSSSGIKVVFLAFLEIIPHLLVYGFRAAWLIDWWLGKFSKYSPGYQGSFLDALRQIDANLAARHQQSDATTGLQRDSEGTPPVNPLLP